LPGASLPGIQDRPDQPRGDVAAAQAGCIRAVVAEQNVRYALVIFGSTSLILSIVLFAQPALPS
jgi:hypothetical protein